jgi:hypothetical protein
MANCPLNPTSKPSERKFSKIKRPLWKFSLPKPVLRSDDKVSCGAPDDHPSSFTASDAWILSRFTYQIAIRDYKNV